MRSPEMRNYALDGVLAVLARRERIEIIDMYTLGVFLISTEYGDEEDDALAKAESQTEEASS